MFVFIQTTYKNKHKDKTFFFKIYLILAVLSLRGCPGAFSSWVSSGYSPAAVHRLLIAAASFLAEHKL